MPNLRYIIIGLLGGIPITPAMKRRGIVGEAQIKRLYDKTFQYTEADRYSA